MATKPFHYQEMFPLGADTTEYYHLTSEYVRTEFSPCTIAVPVSWQKGSWPFAATSALRSMVRATNLSFSLASGSARICIFGFALDTFAR